MPKCSQYMCEICVWYVFMNLVHLKRGDLWTGKGVAGITEEGVVNRLQRVWLAYVAMD